MKTVCKCGGHKEHRARLCRDCYSAKALTMPHHKRVAIPMDTLQAACQRLQAGERWEDVLASIGIGRTALRGCLKRAGMQYEFGRLGHAYKTKKSKMKASHMLSTKMLSVSLRVSV